MDEPILQALARLNRDARAGVLVSRTTIYALKYRAIAAAIADGSARVALGFALVHIGGIRWHIPDHVEPGRTWAAGAPVVDAGQWQPGEREERRAPMDVLTDLVAVEQALGSAGEYDLELGAMGDTGHPHEVALGPPFPQRHRQGRLCWTATTCWGCMATPVATPLAHPLVAAWAALHPGCLDYTQPPPVPRRRRA